MVDWHAPGVGGGTTPVGAFLMNVASLEWASRDLPRSISIVEFDLAEAWVWVTREDSRGRYGPFAYDIERSALAAELVRHAGLAEPEPGPALPYVIGSGSASPWRHRWAELLWDLGQYGYALRDWDQFPTLRYESVGVDEEEAVATVVVVDGNHHRWITRLRLGPPSADVTSAAFDISTWIAGGKGRVRPDGAREFELSWGYRPGP
jgi:hypothetical protein